MESLDKPSGMFDQEWETILIDVRNYLKDSGLTAWHPPQKIGFFRHIVVRKSFYQDKLLINLVTSSEGVENFNATEFSKFLIEKLGDRLAGLQHTINDNVADRAKIENGDCTLLHGSRKIIEKTSRFGVRNINGKFFSNEPEMR